MTPPFRYPDEDWRAIEACLTKLVPHADATYAPVGATHIEAMVHGYLWRMAHFDPRSPEQIAVKACWAKIAKHAHALHAAVDRTGGDRSVADGGTSQHVMFAANPTDAACRLSGLEEPDRGGGTLGGKGGEGF